LKKIDRAPAVVICSVEAGSETVEAAHRAGALGYVVKVCMTRDLVAAVRSAARGQAFLSSEPAKLA
jgi:DNA-binding NarL/FixJ family response regulator